jgi:hypothetical protein
MLHFIMMLPHTPQVWLRIRSGCRLVIRVLSSLPQRFPLSGVLDAALECAAKEPEHLEVVTNRRSPNWFEANSNREALNNFEGDYISK